MWTEDETLHMIYSTVCCCFGSVEAGGLVPPPPPPPSAKMRDANGGERLMNVPSPDSIKRCVAHLKRARASLGKAIEELDFEGM